jgi:hypothetical protein
MTVRGYTLSKSQAFLKNWVNLLLISRIIVRRTTQRQVLAEALIAKHAGSVCGLELRKPDQDEWVVILPDPSDLKGSFKVQHLDRAGFGKHGGGYRTPEDALRQAVVCEGFTEEAPGIVEALFTSSPWQTRYRTVMPVTL